MKRQRRKAQGPVTVLAIADEERPALTIPGGVDFGPGNHPDLLLSAGDVDFSYVAAVADAFDVPSVMVPGNHDRSLEGFAPSPIGWVRAGRHVDWPGPKGAWAADRNVVDVAGLRIAGLGGCRRYSAGSNQWTDAQARRRAMRVLRQARRGSRSRGGAVAGSVDIVLTHAPGTSGPAASQPADDDPVHRGLPAIDLLLDRLQPALHLHGHVHMHGAPRSVFSLTPGAAGHATLVVNTVGYTLTRIHPADANSHSRPRAELIQKGR